MAGRLSRRSHCKTSPSGCMMMRATARFRVWKATLATRSSRRMGRSCAIGSSKRCQVRHQQRSRTGLDGRSGVGAFRAAGAGLSADRLRHLAGWPPGRHGGAGSRRKATALASSAGRARTSAADPECGRPACALRTRRRDLFYRDGGAVRLCVSRPAGRTGLQKALAQPVLALSSVTPNGEWIEAWAPVARTQELWFNSLLRGGTPVIIGSNTALHWSRSGDALWVSGGAVADGRTYIIPLRPGEVLPPISADGFHSEEEIARLPGAQLIGFGGAPGPSLGTYAFLRSTTQRNLYRVPIP